MVAGQADHSLDQVDIFAGIRRTQDGDVAALRTTQDVLAVPLEVSSFVDPQEFARRQRRLHAWPFDAEVLGHATHAQEQHNHQQDCLRELTSEVLQTSPERAPLRGHMWRVDGRRQREVLVHRGPEYRPGGAKRQITARRNSPLTIPGAPLGK